MDKKDLRAMQEAIMAQMEAAQEAKNTLREEERIKKDLLEAQMGVLDARNIHLEPYLSRLNDFHPISIEDQINTLLASRGVKDWLENMIKREQVRAQLAELEETQDEQTESGDGKRLYEEIRPINLALESGGTDKETRQMLMEAIYDRITGEARRRIR